MDELERARIRVYRNDPAGRGERLVASAPPLFVDAGDWAFRVEGRTPDPKAWPTDTREFLHWQLAFALDRGKRLWQRLRPGGSWVPGPVLPAVPVAGEDLNAYYDREALRFFRDTDAKTGEIVQSGDSVDVATHEQGHAVLDALRPDLWDAPHFEVAAFHEAFGDLAAILVAFDDPPLASGVVAETSGDPSRSNLVSRMAEELGAAVRARYGEDATMPRSLRDAVNDFRYSDPKTLPDSAPAAELSAEPHSFSGVMTGALWDVLVALFRARPPEDAARSLRSASDALARHALAAAESAPSGAGFFARVARRIAREADAAREEAARSGRECARSPRPPRRRRRRARLSIPTRTATSPPPARTSPSRPRCARPSKPDCPAPGRASSCVWRHAGRPEAVSSAAGAGATSCCAAASTDPPTARRWSSPTPSPWLFPSPASCGRRACTRPATATPTTPGHSPAFSRAGGRSPTSSRGAPAPGAWPEPENLMR